MKRLSNRAIHATTRAKALYYASRASHRYGKRFAWERHYKAQRLHSKWLRDDMKRFGLRWPVDYMSWVSLASNHKKRFNAKHIAVMEQSAQREKDRQARHDAEISEGVNRALLNLAIGAISNEKQL